MMSREEQSRGSGGEVSRLDPNNTARRSELSMADISTFKVVLEDKERVYYPGDSVYGQVKLKIKKSLKFKELRLECLGEAEVSWPEWSGTYTKYCYNRQTYLELSAVLCPTKDSTAFEKVLQQSVDGNCSRVFSKGNHCFSFYVVLPSDVDLPPSLEGKFGFIRYWLRGVIERGRGKSDLKTSDERILIGDNASTEDFEEALKPIELHQRKEVGLPCCVAGELELNLKAKKGAYCPGDVIHFSFALDNSTSRDVTEVQVALTQRTVYISSEDAKFGTSEELEQINTGCVKSGDHVNYADVALSIPETIKPTIYSSECIALLYYLQVTVKFVGKTKSSSTSFAHVPIVSGRRTADINTNSARRAGALFCVTGTKRDGEGSLFCMTGTPQNYITRPQPKKLQSKEITRNSNEAGVSVGHFDLQRNSVSQKNLPSLVDGHYKSSSIQITPSFPFRKTVLHLTGAHSKQQPHQAYRRFEYL